MELLCNAVITTVLAGVVSYIVANYSEKRNIHRSLLDPYIADLGNNLYSILACLSIYHKKIKAKGITDDFAKNWQDKAEKYKDEIIKIRLKVRYPLDGIIDELRVLALAANWGQAYKDNEKQFSIFFDLCNALRKELDSAILESYQKGSRISRKRVISVKAASQNLITFFQENRKVPVEEIGQEIVYDEDILLQLRNSVAKKL